LLAERNRTPCIAGTELFRAYLETSIDRLNPLEVLVFPREAEDSRPERFYVEGLVDYWEFSRAWARVC
jgi:hypothetical protein